MTAYRLHFEKGNLDSIEAIQTGKIGEARLFTSVHTMQVNPGNIRTDLSLGGGPLEDIGIYCLNAARYVFQAEPEECHPGQGSPLQGNPRGSQRHGALFRQSAGNVSLRLRRDQDFRVSRD